MWLHHDVRIAKNDALASGGGEACVPRGVPALVRLDDEMNAVAVRLKHLFCSVRGPVIHNNDLKRLHTLRKDALQTRRNRRGVLIGRNDNGNITHNNAASLANWTSGVNSRRTRSRAASPRPSRSPLSRPRRSKAPARASISPSGTRNPVSPFKT